MTSVLEAPARATARQASRQKEGTGDRLRAGSALGLGTAVVWMSLVVLRPLAAVVAKGFAGGWSGFWADITTPAALHALEEAIDSLQPQLVVCVGLAGGRSEVMMMGALCFTQVSMSFISRSLEAWQIWLTA